MPRQGPAIQAGNVTRILAGYAIAVPVGPIAILIFDTGLRRGLREAAAA